MLKGSGAEGVLADGLIALRKGHELALTYSDDTRVVFENFFAVCKSEDLCSLMLPSTDVTGTPYILSGGTNGGAYADDVPFVLSGLSDGAGASSNGASSLMYSHGDKDSLQQIATGIDPSGGLAVPGGSSDEFAVASPRDYGAVVVPILAIGGLALLAKSLRGHSGNDEVPPSFTVVQGAVLHGPAVPNHGLTITLYKADGSILVAETALNADGSFSASFLSTYKGIVLARVRDSSIGADYVDEATGAAKDLTTDLRAVFVANGTGTLNVSITPLTELATRLLLKDDGGDTNSAVTVGTTKTATDVNAQNNAVSNAFGITDVLSGMTTVLSSGYNDSLSTDAQKYARALAKLSGLDARTGGVSNTLEALKQEMSTGALSATGQNMLIDGSAIFESGSNAALANLIAAGTPLIAPSASNVKAANSARSQGELSDGLVNADESADGATLVVALAGNMVAGDTLTLTLSASASGTLQTTSSQTVTTADVVRGFANVLVTKAMLDASGEGVKILKSTQTHAASSLVLDVDGFTYDPSLTIVQGSVALGPVSTGHGLKVTFYKVDGTVLVAETAVGADGVFTGSFSSTYKGIVLARVRDASTGVDYIDEATGASKDLTTDLRAVFTVNGAGTVNVSVTPLTELATRLLLNDTGGDTNAGIRVGATITAADVTSQNSAVSNAFGITDVLGSMTTLLSVDYNDALVADAQKYARVLAKLSGLDARTNGVSNTIEMLKAQLSGSAMSVTGQTLLADGAAIFESGSNAALANLITSSTALAQPSAANLSASAAAKSMGELSDGVINATESVDGTTVAVALAGNVVRGDTLTLTLSGTAGGVSQTTSAYTVTAVDVTRGYANIAVTQAQLDASGEGVKIITSEQSHVTNNLGVNVDSFSYAPGETVVQGSVALGPVSIGHGLKVTLYKSDGAVLMAETAVSADGTFIGRFSSSYKGVVLARVKDTSVGTDYTDEATGVSKDLTTDLRAVFGVNGAGTVNVSISPLTELATRLLLTDTGGDTNASVTVGLTKTAADVTAQNSAVSNAFGITDVLGGMTTVLSSGYNDSLATDAQKYARVLAKLSGLDARTGGVSNTLEALKLEISAGALSATGTNMLADGAAIFESGSNAAASNLITSGTALALPSAANVLVAVSARSSGELSDGVINATEATDGTTVAVALAGNVVAGDFVTLTLSATAGGVLQTTSAYRVTSADVIRGYANIAVTQAQLDASGEGEKTVTSTQTHVANTQTVSAGSFTYDPGSTTVQGSVALGPVSTGHGLKVTFYKADGTVLVPETAVNADGTFTGTFSSSYKGVVLARVKDASVGTDYTDEATGVFKDLTTDLRAVFNATGEGSMNVSITPLSELATRILLNDTGGDTTSGNVVGLTKTVSTVTAANSSVSNAFGVTDVLGSMTTVLSAGYNDSVITDAQKYARVLAKLSGLDARTGGVSNTLEALKLEISAGSLSATGQNMLADGAAIFESGSNAGLSNLVSSTVALTQPSAANLFTAAAAKSVGELSDSVINAVESADGTTVSVALAGNMVAGDAVTLTLSGTGSGVSQTTSAYGVTAADVIRGYANVSISKNILDASGEGVSKIITATEYHGLNSLQLSVHDSVTYDATAPSVAFGVFIATDDRINLAESTSSAALLISGTSEAGATVDLQIAGFTRIPQIENGTWRYGLTALDLSNLGQGTKSIFVHATDAAGNTHDIDKSITIDTIKPTIAINTVASDDNIDLTEKTAGISISGTTTAEPGQTVTVTWGGVTKTGLVTEGGNWTAAMFATNELPADGSANISATISDAAGNPADAVTHSVSINSYLGGSGADVFSFALGTTGTQTITNFSSSQNDKIYLKDLLGSGYDAAHMTNFLQMNQSGNDAVLKVDVQGAGNFSTPEETITIANGWLVTAGFNSALVDLVGHQIIVM